MSRFLLEFQSTSSRLKKFELAESEKVVIVGNTGSGKTTWLRELVFLKNHAESSILFEGRRVEPSWISEYRARVQLIFQTGYRSFQAVSEHFEEVARLQVYGGRESFSPEAYLEKTLQGMRALNQDHLWSQGRKLQELSGGELQCISLIRSVCLGPSVLLLDESTSAMDGELKQKTESWLQKEYSGAWIWVSHDREQVERLKKNHAARVLEF